MLKNWLNALFINLNRSKIMLLVQMTSTILAVVSIYLTSLSLLLKYGFVLFVLILFIYYFIRKYLYFNRYEIVAIESKGKEWVIHWSSHKKYLTKLLDSTVITRFYISLEFEVISLKKRYRLFILRDSLDSEDTFRCLIRQIKLTY